MKKKVFLGIIFIIFFFTAGGLYLTDSFFKATNVLQHIIVLQKMDFTNKTFLDNIETIQTDLLLKDTPHALDFNIFFQHVRSMEEQLHQCAECHHTAKMSERIGKLERHIETYMHGLSRVYTLKSDRERQMQELDSTFALGNQLIEQVNGIIDASGDRLSKEASMAKVSISSTNFILVILVTLGPLLFVVATFVFVRGLARSLTVLTNATRRLKSGNLQYRITEELKDEFGELASSFNDMAASLQEHYQKLQQTERLAVVGELAAGIAHEVKNPLAGIKVSMEVLNHDLDLEQEDREIFLQVVNEIDRINALLRNLLNYARPPKPESVPFDVHSVLETTIKSAWYSLKGPAEDNGGREKKIEFVKDFSPEVPNIVADPGQLRQVFLNLLLNSRDAIAEEGTITVRTRKLSDDSIQITVSDDGKGIDNKSLENIFKPFFTTKNHGTGLGLAICKRLIEQQNGGTITAANNTGGPGVTFTITLPIQSDGETTQQ